MGRRVAQACEHTAERVGQSALARFLGARRHRGQSHQRRAALTALEHGINELDSVLVTSCPPTDLVHETGCGVDIDRHLLPCPRSEDD